MNKTTTIFLSLMSAVLLGLFGWAIYLHHFTKQTPCCPPSNQFVRPPEVIIEREREVTPPQPPIVVPPPIVTPPPIYVQPKPYYPPGYRYRPHQQPPRVQPQPHQQPPRGQPYKVEPPRQQPPRVQPQQPPRGQPNQPGCGPQGCPPGENSPQGKSLPPPITK